MSSTSTYTNNGVVYAYTPNVEMSAHVTSSPDATETITILKEFTVNDTIYRVTYIAESAFETTLVKSVIFPSDSYVTLIGQKAFYNCALKNTLFIPDSVTTIENNAFEANEISTLTGLKNVETIGKYAFASNKITAVTIPNKVTNISDYAFFGNNADLLLILGSDVNVIGISAFQKNNFTKVFLPKSIVSLGGSAFKNNTILTDVYFFQTDTLPSFGVNCFNGNSDVISAYYLDGVNVSTIPSIFGNRKTILTLVQMLDPLLKNGVSIETLDKDDYTFEDIAYAGGADVGTTAEDIDRASATASQLLGYYNLTRVALSRYIPFSQFTVSVLNTTATALNITLTIDDFKTAGASIQQVYDYYGLPEMIRAGYKVADIYSGVTTVINTITPPTISDFKNANADKQQMLTQFGLQSMWDINYYSFDDLTTLKVDISLTVTVTVAQWWALSSDTSVHRQKPTVSVLNTKYGLQKLWTGIYSLEPTTAVSTIYDALNTSVANFWALSTDSRPTVLQIYNVYELQDLWTGIYSLEVTTAVSTIRSALSTTVAQWWALTNGPTAQQLFDGGYTSLQDLWNGIYAVTPSTAVETIKNITNNGDPNDLVYKFWSLTNGKPTVQQLYDGGFDLSQIWGGLRRAKSDTALADTYDGLPNYNGTNLNPSVQQFRNVSGTKPSVQQLSTRYNLQQLWDGIQNVQTIYDGLVSTPSALDFKNLTNPPTVSQLYRASGGYNLNELVGAGYNVDDIIAGVDGLGIHDFKLNGASIQQVYDKYGLGAMINMPVDPYTVAAIYSGVTTVANTITRVTVDAFKEDGAPIQDVLDVFGYAAMIGVDYYVKDIVALDNTLTFSDFYNVPTPTWNLMTYYLFTDHSDDLLSRSTVAVIKAAGNLEISASDNNNLTATHFRTANAPIWQILNAFSLSDLIHLYTTTDLVTASQNPGVTVEGNKNLTISQMKTAGDELYQVMNYYGQYGNGLVDLLSVDYFVDDLVAESKMVDGNYLVTVTDLQDLDNKLTSFVAANNTITTANSSQSKLWNLVRQFSLADLLPVPDYSVHSLNATASNSNVPSAKKPTIDLFKAADPTNVYIQQIYEEFKTAGTYRLSEMIRVGYKVEDIVQHVSDSPALTIADFKAASAPIQQVFDNFELSEMIQTMENPYTPYAPYTVATIYSGVTTPPTIDDFKDADPTNVYIQDIYNVFKTVGTYRLSAMIGAIYKVEDIVLYVTDSPVLTIADFKNASAPIQQVYGQFGLDAMINMPVDPYTVAAIYSGVTTVANTITRVTVGAFKTVGAPIQDVYVQFGLTAMITALYTVAEIYSGVTTDPDLNIRTRVTIDDFKLAGAPIQDVYDQFKTLGTYRLSEMIRVGYKVEDIVQYVSDSPSLTIADFKAASAPIQQVFDNFLLSEMIQTMENPYTPYTPYTVATIYSDVTTVINTTTPPTIDDFKDADPTNVYIQDIYNVFKTVGTYRLSAMIGAIYKVEDIVLYVTDSPVLTIADFKNASAPIQQVYGQFGLDAMINMPVDPYTVAAIYSGVTTVANTITRVTVGAFKTVGAPIQDVLDVFGYAAMIGVDYYVKDIVALDNTLTFSDFYNVPTPTWNLMTYYLFTDHSDDLLSRSTVAVIKDASALSYSAQGNRGQGPAYLGLTVTDFRTANAPIWQMLNVFLLSQLIHLYTTEELVTASKNPGVTVQVNQNLSIDTMKSENDELYQMMNYYSLPDLLQVGYRVSDLITASNLKDESENYLVTVEALQNLGTTTPITGGLARFVTANSIVIDRTAPSKLWDLILNFPLADLLLQYSVHELIVANFYLDGDDKVTISKLKIANADVQDMLTEFELQAMWNAGYTVGQLKIVNVSVADFWALTSDKPTIQQLYTEYELQGLWDYFGDVVIIYNGLTLKPTVSNWWDLSSDTTSHREKPTIQQLYSSTKYGLQNFWDYFGNVATIYTELDSKPTVSNWWDLSSDTTSHRDKPTIQQLYSSTKYGLQELWDYFGDVATIYGELDSKPTVSNWWDLSGGKPTIQQLYSSTKYGLQELWDYFKNVATIYNGLTATPPSVGDFNGLSSDTTAHSAKPTIAQIKSSAKYTEQQVYNTVSLTEMITAEYSVDEIYSGVTPHPTIDDFKDAGAPIQQVYGTFGLTAMINMSVDPYTVAEIYSGVTTVANTITPPAIAAFKAAGAPIQDVYNQFKESGAVPRLSTMITAYTVSDIYLSVTDSPVLTIVDFKAAGAPIQQVYDQFGLTPMLAIRPNPYTVAAIYSGVTTVANTITPPAIADFKDAGAPIQDVYNQFKPSGTVPRLSNMITAFYTVAEIYSDVTDSPVITIADFKAAGAPIQQVYDQFKDSEVYYRLSQMIAAEYTVAEIYSGVTDTNSPLTIADFKDAEAPIQQVYDQFKTSGTYRLSKMLAINPTPYTVAKIYSDVTDTTSAITIDDFKNAGAPIQDVYDEFGLPVMITALYTVSEIYSGVTTIANPVTRVTIAEFKAAGASIQQLYDHANFGLAAMIAALYTVAEIIAVVTSLTYDDFNNSPVSTPLWNLMTYYNYSFLLTKGWTVTQIYDLTTDTRVKTGNKNLTATDFLGEDVHAEIWQMLNTFSLVTLTPLYTTTELVTASQNAGVTTIDYNKNLTIEKMQTAEDELYQMMNYYSLPDLLQVDYTVSDLVNASILKDGSGNYRVIVTALQNLGTTTPITGGLARFVAANTTVIGRTNGVSKLWNLINYFELSALLSYYKVHELNATTTDTKVSEDRRVNITSLKIADTPANLYIEDMLTEFGLQAMWDAGYTVSELKSVGVSVADFWALTGNKPTIQQLYHEYGLQFLWTYFGDVAQIYNGLDVKPTVSNWWGLTGGKPSVQQLYDAIITGTTKIYNLQNLWDVIQNVATIRDGLNTSDKPSAADFKALTNPPTVKQLYNEGTGYSLTNLIEALYTVAQIRNTTTGIGQISSETGTQISPTLAEFKAANAPLWQLLNASMFIDITEAGGNSGFKDIDFIKAGYKVSELVTASRLKDGSDNYLVLNSSHNQNMDPLWFYPDNWSTDNTSTGLTEEDKTNLLCDVLSTFEPGACINTYAGSYYQSYYAVPKLIEASNAKINDNTYKVTLEVNQQLNENLSRFITGSNKVNSWELYRLTRYRSVFTTFSIFDLEAAYGISNIMEANNNRDPNGNQWDAGHADWRVTIAELKSANVPIANIIIYYGQTKENLQLLLDAGYSISDLRIASNDTTLYNRITVAKFLALTTPKTIRELQAGGYELQELFLGVSPDNTHSISPLLDTTTGYTPVPTIAVLMELEYYPTNQQLYNAYELQTLYNAIAPNVDYRITLSSVVDQVSPKISVAQWWALSPKPTVQNLSDVGYVLQDLWDEIGDVSAIYNGFNNKSYASVANFWGLSSNTTLHRAKPTIQQLHNAKNGSVSIFGLQELWEGVYSLEPETAVATIYNGLTSKPIVADFWALTGGKPTIQQLNAIYNLQSLWEGVYSLEPETAVATIYIGLTSKPTVAQWWALTSGKPTVQELISSTKYVLQDLWDEIGSIKTIYDGLTSKPTIGNFWLLSNPLLTHRVKPTIIQLLDSYNVAQILSAGYSTISDILYSASNDTTGSKTVLDVVNELKAAGCKIVIPAPRITTASFLTGAVTLKVSQATPDIPITKYLYSHSSDGGITWSEYTDVTNNVNGDPLLPNSNKDLIITGFDTINKLHSFRITADAFGIISNTSNTFRNVFF